MDDISVAGSSPAAESRRRSGRVVKKPTHLVEQAGVSAKRKRIASQGGDAEDEDGDVDMLEDEEDDESSSEQDDSADEDVQPQKKRARKSTAGTSSRRKPAKSRDNGVDLAIRPATTSRSAKSRAKKTARFSTAANAGGLYCNADAQSYEISTDSLLAEVFGKGRPLDDVSTEWIGRYKTDESASMAELFTFSLRCAGCDYEVEEDIATDPDTFKDKISEIQDKYQAENVTEYPLIAKSRSTVTFKNSLDAFIQSLVITIDKADLLFGEDTIESFTAWISTMSSSGNRALRHTATFIAMSVLSALCQVGADLVDKKSKLERQMEGERKKSKTSNKARLAEINKSKNTIDQQLTALKERLTDVFDTVFVHRYRDIDPHIRLDCIRVLGSCILIYPDMFFEGAYLRYLGWMISDQKPEVRHEALKSLLRLYQDQSKLAGLESFTEKFRPRIIEMAAQDSDAGVRSTAIQMLNLWRAAGFLEPNDIDAIGRLIFDSELRVRKAVVGFFVANVNDSYDLMLDELGGNEAVEEIFGENDPEEEDYDSPQLIWLKFKALVDQLQSYDAQLEVEPAEMVHVPQTSTYMLVPGLQSRFSLAAEGICEHIPELRWEALAGYLLYDHTQRATNGRSNGVDSMGQFKQAVRLNPDAEILLLEVLNTAVRLTLSNSTAALQDKSRKVTKAQRVVEQDALESGARHLTTLIPRLLHKFGAVPEATSAILRLEHVLDPENQDYNSYGVLLEDIKKQFLAHAKPSVLEEASLALLHAKSAAEADELAQEKLSSLAEDAVEKLNKLAGTADLTARGTLEEDQLELLEGCVTRLEMLGRVEDFSTLLETAPAQSRKKGAQPGPIPIDLLISLLGRGEFAGHTDTETQTHEDNIVRNTARALLSYLMWKTRSFQSQLKSSGNIAPAQVKAVAIRKGKIFQGLTKVVEQKIIAEDLRATLAGALIDLSVTFASLLSFGAATKGATQPSEAATKALSHLAQEIPAKTQSTLLRILSAAEKTYAKRSRRALETADGDEPATDDEPEDDEDEQEQEDAEFQLRATLVAEQRLCEISGKLVLGIWAGVIDGKKEGQKDMVRKRLKRNKTRLGPNFKAIVEMMERGGPSSVTKAKSTAAKPAATGQQSAAEQAKKSDAIVVDSDESSDEDDAEAGNEEEEEEEQQDERAQPEEEDEVVDDEPESVLGD